MKEQILRLAKGTAVYGLGGLLSRFISLLLLPLFTAYLTPADYGVAALLNLLSFFLVPVASLGVGTSFGICFTDPSLPQGRHETVWTSFALLSGSCAVLLAAGIPLSGEISRLVFMTPAHAGLVTLSVLTTAASVMAMPFTLRLQFEERAKLYVLLGVAASLASTAAAVAMVVVWRMGARGLVAATLVGQVATLLLYAVACRDVPVRLSTPVGKTLVRLGAPMIPAFALLFVIQQGNRYVLQYSRGVDLVGLYSVGHSIGMTMNLLVAAFTTAWTPYFLSFAGKAEEAGRTFGRIFTSYVYAFGALGLCFYIFARPVVLIMAKPPFHEAYRAVGHTATSCILTGVFSLFLPGVYFAREVKYVTVVQAAAAAGTVLAGLLLIPPFGLSGAAVVLLLGAFLMAALMHAWNVRRREAYLRVEYEWGRVLPFAALYAVAAVLLSAARALPLRVELVIAAASAAALAATMVLLLRGTERKAVAEILRDVIAGGRAVPGGGGSPP